MKNTVFDFKRGNRDDGTFWSEYKLKEPLEGGISTLTVSTEENGQSMISLTWKHDHPHTSGYMSCSPKFEPVYKVQSLTERGRFYDWHEEAA